MSACCLEKQMPIVADRSPADEQEQLTNGQAMLKMRLPVHLFEAPRHDDSEWDPSTLASENVSGQRSFSQSLIVMLPAARAAVAAVVAGAAAAAAAARAPQPRPAQMLQLHLMFLLAKREMVSPPNQERRCNETLSVQSLFLLEVMHTS